MIPRQKLFHAVPAWVPDDAVFFITINCVVRGKNSLAFSDVAKSLFDGMRVYEEQRKWWIHFALLMPDHLHLLISFGIQCEMVRTINHWKQYWARRLGIKWQKDFFEHRIRSEEQCTEKYEYIRFNPVRKGLAKTPEEWPYAWMPER